MDEGRKNGDTWTDSAPEAVAGKGHESALRYAEALTDKRARFVVGSDLDAEAVKYAGVPSIILRTPEDREEFRNAVIVRGGDLPPLVLALPRSSQDDRYSYRRILDELRSKGAAVVESGIESPIAFLSNMSGAEYEETYKETIRDLLRDVETMGAGEAKEDERRERAAIREAEYYDAYGMEGMAADFMGWVQRESSTPALPTGFHRLDEVLAGGLRPSLYILGAASSLGKTTLISQIADHIAASGRDVLMYSLEMGRYELLCRSVSRITDEMNPKDERMAKPARALMDYASYSRYSDLERSAITAAHERYHATISRRLCIVEGDGRITAADIVAQATKAREATGRIPVVIVDYLQILRPIPGERFESERMAMDRSVTTLKLLSRDYRTPVIVVSSVNRDGYFMPINESSFKESGGIEYGADVLLGLQLAVAETWDATKAGGKGDAIKRGQQEKAKDIRDMLVKVLKNRNGKQHPGIEFTYRTTYSRFIERPADALADFGGGAYGDTIDTRKRPRKSTERSILPD